ncbi:MAG: CopD family protein [Pseudomonadota bacterium]
MFALWIKALHLIFMVTWFAGLFYLPRLFIYHASASGEANHTMFQTMERRLFSIMTLGGVLTFVFGIWTVSTATFGYALSMGWFHVKLVLLLLLVVHHGWCWVWIKRLRDPDYPVNARWLRFFNEIPAIYLFAIVFLAIVKPF